MSLSVLDQDVGLGEAVSLVDFLDRDEVEIDSLIFLGDTDGFVLSIDCDLHFSLLRFDFPTLHLLGLVTDLGCIREPEGSGLVHRGFEQSAVRLVDVIVEGQLGELQEVLLSRGVSAEGDSLLRQIEVTIIVIRESDADHIESVTIVEMFDGAFAEDVFSRLVEDADEFLKVFRFVSVGLGFDSHFWFFLSIR